jgi:[ribosomal protein S18]-alanine N-acetyltransferase
VIDAAEAGKIVFRPMELEDVEQVYAIDVLSFSLPWSGRSFRFEVAENPASRPWVAESWGIGGKHQVVGMLVLWVVVDEAHVGTIAIHPDYRRQRIGQRLLAHSLLDAFSLGVRRVFLEVRRSNLAAQAMYQKFGFEVDGFRPHYYVDNNEDALMLALRNLSPESIQHLLE